jgi:DNA-binding response OmpR family regulator
VNDRDSAGLILRRGIVAKIMIVDDERELVRALTLRFKSAGFDVVHSGDGVTAMQIAIREQPDAIVLDIGLPGGDGHMVAERLRENSKTMSIPIVYLTARNSQRDMRRANQLGAAGYIMKPFKAESLVSLVSSLVGNPVEAG